MSATQTIELVDKLVRAKIPKQTATELIDYVDERKDKAVNLQWVAIAILASGLIAIFGLLWGLKTEIHNLDKRMEKIEAGQGENRKILLQILKKR